MSLSFNPEEMNKEIVHSEKGLKIELINSLADTTRQFDEKNLSTIGRQTDQLANDVANKLIAFLKKQKTDNVTIRSIGKNLAKNDNNLFDGTIDYTFKVLHSGLTKDIGIKIAIKNNSFDMPNATVITAEMENAVSSEETTNNALKTEMEANIAAITASVNEPLEKEANIQTTMAPHPVIFVQKAWLPSSLKMGDVINLEGAKYKIVADDHNKMSSGSDGIFWTLREVTETRDGGPEITV